MREVRHTTSTRGQIRPGDAKGMLISNNLASNLFLNSHTFCKEMGERPERDSRAGEGRGGAKEKEKYPNKRACYGGTVQQWRRRGQPRPQSEGLFQIQNNPAPHSSDRPIVLLLNGVSLHSTGWP